MKERKQVSIEPDIFSWPSDSPRLMGEQCRDCSNITFPPAGSCPKCGGTAQESIELKTEGTLWTWTSQEFPPKNLRDYNDPELFKPYYLGYVELPGQVRVETRLLIDSCSKIKIGMPMKLTIFKFREEPDGTETMTYAFEPAEI